MSMAENIMLNSFGFRIKIMSNVRATVVDMKISRKSNIANYIETDNNLLLAIQSMALSLKAHVLAVALIVWH